MIRLLFFYPSQADGFAASMRFALHLLWSFFATPDHNEAFIKTISDYEKTLDNRI